MLEKIIKDYFSFTRKERIAVLTLVFLTIIIALLPYCLPEKVESPGKMGFDTLRLQLDRMMVAKKEPWTTTRDDKVNVSGSVQHSSYETGSFDRKNASSKAELFYFDPNSLSAEGWKRLGLRDKTIQTIQNYISKGGRFRRSEDIEKIYGLHAEEVARLTPYIKIAPAKANTSVEYQPALLSAGQLSKSAPPFQKPLRTPLSIDINTADTADWIALPGIGSKLASRIVLFREKLGGFYSIEQLSEIYGLPDSTFQQLKPLLKIKTPAVAFININTAQANDLKQHPYIKWNLANAIVEFRKQHGEFKSLDDLQKIDIIKEETYRKIVPYLKIE